MKIADIPLITKVAALPELEPGSLVELGISDVDLLALTFRAEYRGVAAAAPQ